MNKASKLFTLSRSVVALMTFCVLANGLQSEDKTQRIISLDGPITETVYALGKGDQVVAVDLSSTIPAAARSLPKVGYIRQISAEGVLSLRPTLVVASDAMSPAEAVEQIRSSNIRLELLNSPHTLEDVRKNITKLGELLSAEDEAEKLLKQFDASIEEVNTIVSQMEKTPKVVFLMSGGTDGSWRAAGARTRAHGLIELAGGQNLFAQASAYQTISSESLLALNPDVILIGAQPGTESHARSAFERDAQLSLLSAVRKQQVHVIDLGVDLNFGPGLADAVKNLATKLAQAR